MTCHGCSLSGFPEEPRGDHLHLQEPSAECCSGELGGVWEEAGVQSGGCPSSFLDRPLDLVAGLWISFSRSREAMCECGREVSASPFHSLIHCRAFPVPMRWLCPSHGRVSEACSFLRDEDYREWNYNSVPGACFLVIVRPVQQS